MAIPKIIHYCWFGGNELPENAVKCINSWKEKCPGFEVRKWTEKDIDLSMNEYTRQAYEAKAWGFVPDYLRLWIIYNYGGIYLDTDVQVIRDLSPLCRHKAFAGMESEDYVALGLGFGAEQYDELIHQHMIVYDGLRYINFDGTANRTPSPSYTTELLVKYGFQRGRTEIQKVGDIVIYPPEYFCPKSFKTGMTRITKNTYSIHHFDASWYSAEEQKNKEARWKAAKADYYKHLPNRIAKRILGDKYEKLKLLLKR